MAEGYAHLDTGFEILRVQEGTMYKKPLESDWKTFRKRVPEWRERYLRRKNRDIVNRLTAPAKTATEQFWDAKQTLDEEARTLRECLDGHSRSKMQWYLILMYRHGLIHDSDLNELSEEVRDHVLKASKVFDE